MAYADAVERSNLIAGLHALAEFLEGHPEVPAPRWADVMVFPPASTDNEMHAAIDQIALLIKAEVTDATANAGHYTTSCHFGPVQYRAVAIPVSKQTPREPGTRHPETEKPDTEKEA